VSAPFEAGERLVLIDQRGRTYLFALQGGGTYHTHSGTLSHDALIGRPEGTRVETAGGMVLTAFRPRFADYALKMKRGAQVIYPKDLGPILTYADIYPGARTLEAGTGSGAMTIALCRAVGDAGRVVSYDVREEHHDQALPAQGFLPIETFEVLRRGWHVTERSVRPDHRMVGHTGFLTIARRTS